MADLAARPGSVVTAWVPNDCGRIRSCRADRSARSRSECHSCDCRRRKNGQRHCALRLEPFLIAVSDAGRACSLTRVGGTGRRRRVHAHDARGEGIGVMAAERGGINGIMAASGDDLITGDRRDVRSAARGRHVRHAVAVHRNRRNSGRVQILLSAALQNGWRIVHPSPEEQALLDAHGFGSGRVQ
jgi:hypothetical protein